MSAWQCILGIPFKRGARHPPIEYLEPEEIDGLLKAGVDLATISHWLGHASVNTTMCYARADLDFKRQALLQVFPDVLAPASPRTDPCITKATLVDWLKRL